ncbi:MAG TPA: PVC-type heme-binding CxxCH protein [Pirellulaceae bacterium]
MFRFACLLLAVPLAASAQSPPATHTISLDGHNFTLPVGFTIERAAGESLVRLPISGDFDEQGRLYIAEAGGAITKPEVAEEKPAHRIVRLVDTDNDGRYDKSTLFVDAIAFPEGALWREGSLYVTAPPKIWKFTDTNDDGIADKREVWFDAKTLTGCANDLHGPFEGPDGWIYWNKGAFAKQTYTLPSGRTFETRAAHIFRARPDGSGIEPVMTGGMDNPVDTVFTPGGERIFSTTFFQRPAAGFRDGLIHAIYGGIYGKDHDPVYEPQHKWTSPDFMPVLVHQGPSAPCGLWRYQSDQFGPDYRDNVFSCQFNMRKISRHVLKPSGATFSTEDYDFVVSDNTDFHPTDVFEDADGSLLIFNTGGWYKLCCPSSQLAKDDVLGGVYRVRKTGSHKASDPRGTMVAWKTSSPANLALLLSDSRASWRNRAVKELGQRGGAALSSLAPILANPKLPPTTAIAAISAASRIDGAEARKAIRSALNHDDETVRQAAIHTISVWRDQQAVPGLVKLLESPSRHNRRAAAEALGRVGDSSVTPALLAALADGANDRALDHSLTYALIDIGENDPLRKAVGSSDVKIRRAALIALDQTGAQLDSKLIIDRLDDGDEATRDAARWIAGRHSEWAADLAAYADSRLSAPLAEQDAKQLVELLGKLAKGPAIQKLLADKAKAGTMNPAAANLALAAIGASGLKELPDTWAEAIRGLLSNDSKLTGEALAAIRAVPPTKSQAESVAAVLLHVGDSAPSPETRLTALSLVPGGAKKVSGSQLALLLSFIDHEQPSNLRGMAADVFSKAKLSSAQLVELAAQLPHANPLELDRLLSAFAQSTDDAVGLKLLDVLGTAELRGTVTVDAIKQRLAKYSSAVKAEAQKLYAVINADYEQQSQRLEDAIAALPPGDIRRGQAIFNSAKVSCKNCHTIGYLGGRIGPDLTRIGQIRQPRDLVDSILFPSSAFVRGYEPVLVKTAEGQIHSGNIKKDAPDEVILTLAADKEIRIPRGEVEEMLPGKVSVMPAGLDKQLSLQELADLVEFLRNCK